jgi:hypothetical protein
VHICRAPAGRACRAGFPHCADHRGRADSGRFFASPTGKRSKVAPTGGRPDSRWRIPTDRRGRRAPTVKNVLMPWWRWCSSSSFASDHYHHHHCHRPPVRKSCQTTCVLVKSYRRTLLYYYFSKNLIGDHSKNANERKMWAHIRTYLLSHRDGRGHELDIRDRKGSPNPHTYAPQRSGFFYFGGGCPTTTRKSEQTNQRPMMMNSSFAAVTVRRRPLRRKRIERTLAERTSLREKRAFQSKVSLILTAVTLGLMLLLALVTTDRNSAAVTYNKDDGRPDELQQQQPDRQSAWRQRRRRLKKDEDNNNDASASASATNTTTDYSHYSCNSLNEVTPIAGDDQCNFATTCNRNVGVWAPIVYCSPHGRIWLIFLSPVMLLWLVLLFRMLGSTAEDYFSPALEMFSGKVRCVRSKNVLPFFLYTYRSLTQLFFIASLHQRPDRTIIYFSFSSSDYHPGLLVFHYWHWAMARPMFRLRLVLLRPIPKLVTNSHSAL